MQTFDARAILDLLKGLSLMERQAEHFHTQLRAATPAADANAWRDPSELRRQVPHVDEAAVASLGTALDQTADAVRQMVSIAEASCEQLQLSSSIAMLRRIRNGLESPFGLEDVGGWVRELGQRIEDDLTGRAFRFIPTDRAKHLEVDVPSFGQDVTHTLPLLAYDIEEASLCIGYGRYTAAVFHLMRVMEAGVRHLAKKLKVPAANVAGPNWSDVQRAINDKIATLPTNTPKRRARKHALQEVSVYLQHVKNAWRNPVMHPDRKYSQSEAESIFRNVGEFMRALVSRS